MVPPWRHHHRHDAPMDGAHARDHLLGLNISICCVEPIMSMNSTDGVLGTAGAERRTVLRQPVGNVGREVAAEIAALGLRHHRPLDVAACPPDRGGDQADGDRRAARSG